MSRLPLLALLLAAAYLRLAHAAETPGWFSDEGTHLNIAAHLLRGRVQYLALTDSTLLVARLPLFDWFLAGLLGLAGAGPGGDLARGMGVLRAFTGGLGVLTTLLLYLAVRRMGGVRGPWLGLLAAFVYALYPQAIVYSRFGFSYNLVAPLLLLVLWAVWEFQRATTRPRLRRRATGWLALASLLVGLATVTDLWAWVLLAPLLGAVLLGGRRLGWPALAGLALAPLPWAFYAATGLRQAPSAFVFDLGFSLFRVSALSLAGQAALLGENLMTLFAQEGWLALGVVGLFRLRPARLRRLALLFFWLPLLLVGRSAALASLSYYYLIPLLPLAALGLGALALDGVAGLARLAGRALRPWLAQRSARWGEAFVVVIVAGLALFLAARSAAQTQAGFATAIDPYLLQPEAALGAAAFVNTHAAPDSLVIASPGLAWLLDTHTADFQMTLAHAGVATPHFPANLAAGRFAFDPALSHARFVVVDNLWRNWAVFNVSGLPVLLAEVEQWPLVFEAGEIRVYRQPGK